MAIKTQAQVVSDLKKAGWTVYGKKTELGSVLLRKGSFTDRRESCVYHDGSVIEYPAGLFK